MELKIVPRSIPEKEHRHDDGGGGRSDEQQRTTRRSTPRFQRGLPR